MKIKKEGEKEKLFLLSSLKQKCINLLFTISNNINIISFISKMQSLFIILKTAL